MQQTKRCSYEHHVGDRELPLTEFYADKSGGKLGLKPKCKVCERLIANNRRKEKSKDPEWRKRFNEQNTKYRKGAGKVGQLYEGARQRAKQKGQEFTITKDDIVIPEFCPILGIKIEAGKGRNRDDPTNKLVGAQDSSPSIDRIDNSKGYTPDNIIVISWRANYLKNTASLQELVLLGEFARKQIDRQNQDQSCT